MKIAKTRDCYNILIKSLEMERQDGAVKILRAHSNYRPMLPAPSSEPLPVRVLVVGDDGTATDLNDIQYFCSVHKISDYLQIAK